MTKLTSIRILTHVCLLSLAAQGCTMLPAAHTALNETGQYQSTDVIYDVKKDDRLSDIAGLLTGNIDNWRLLAQYNQIADPKKLAAGETLRIPRSLLMPVYEINGDLQAQETQRTASVAAASASSPPGGSAAIGNTMAVQRAAEPVQLHSAPVELHKVSINRTFDLVPFDRTLAITNSTPRFASSAPSVRVIGTYFPKGIYAGPANYTKLMMRVSPGTVFELHSEINDWYKVVTDQGIGYLRSADAVLVSDSSS